MFINIIIISSYIIHSRSKQALLSKRLSIRSIVRSFVLSLIPRHTIHSLPSKHVWTKRKRRNTTPNSVLHLTKNSVQQTVSNKNQNQKKHCSIFPQSINQSVSQNSLNKNLFKKSKKVHIYNNNNCINLNIYQNSLFILYFVLNKWFAWCRLLFSFLFLLFL